MNRTIEATLTMQSWDGDTEHVTVRWVPQKIRVDDSQAKIRVHDDVNDPPIQLIETRASRAVGWQSIVQSWTGDREVITEFSEVDDEADLEPGHFFIVDATVGEIEHR